MKPIAVAQLKTIVGGRPLTAMPEGDVLVRAVCTDSRQLDPGCLFIAIKGENHDGHAFVPEMGKGGRSGGGNVVAALVEREPVPLPEGVYVLLVPSSRRAMGRLAAHARAAFSGSVIAVGGSNGKTTTKNLIDAALSPRLRGSISPKSFNNDIGVPLTIFGHDPRADYLVLEMGTNHTGELVVLSEMARPDVAVITSISHEHLEGLGDLAGVRREEASIISGLDRGGVLVVNGDDAELLPLLAPYRGRRVTFGFGEHNDLFACNVSVTAAGTRFRLNKIGPEVFVPLLGRHTASNALAAIAVGRWMGLEESMLIANLAHARGPEMRQQLQVLAGVTVLNDAYNANPASVRSALESLLALEASSGRRVAVIGDMREMGHASDDLHRQVGRFVGGLVLGGGLDAVAFVGSQSKLAMEEAMRAGMPADRATWFENAASVASAIADLVRPGDLLLLKASRGVRLEQVAEALRTMEGEGMGSGGATRRSA